MKWLSLLPAQGGQPASDTPFSIQLVHPGKTHPSVTLLLWHPNLLPKFCFIKWEKEKKE